MADMVKNINVHPRAKNFDLRFTLRHSNIYLKVRYDDCDSSTAINHACHFLTRGRGSEIRHIINSQTVKNHYNFTLMYYGLPVISLGPGWDIVNFQQLLSLWGKLMIQHRRPDLLVARLLLPGQCHKGKTFILICLKAMLFYPNHITFWDKEVTVTKWPVEWAFLFDISNYSWNVYCSTGGGLNGLIEILDKSYVL